MVGPDIEDTDFGVGGAGGGIDDGFKGNTLLEEVLLALIRRDGGEHFVGRSEVDTLPGEGVEGLEDPVIAISRKAIAVLPGKPVAEEDGWGDGGVVKPGQREFADVEIPVGMAGPFDVEGLAVVEAKMDLLADELVSDGAVVNAPNGNEAASVAIAETGWTAGAVSLARYWRCRRCGCRVGRQ